MKLSVDQSYAGVLVPVFAIRTAEDLGIGDTEGVRQMVNWCHRHGLRIFQTLPINETGHDHSPYNAISSQAIDPNIIHISPARLADLTPEMFRQHASPALLAELRQGPVNYSKVTPLKRRLLQGAFDHFLKAHFREDTPRAAAFGRFMAENADWLAAYALFRLLMEENGGSPEWDRWPPEHRDPQRAQTWLLSLLESRREQLMRQQLFFSYTQWIAFDQWRDLKSYATEKHVFLMGDIPFGVSRYSADVWANPSVFELDWSGGTPPEKAFKANQFTRKFGQNWGIPIYRWDELRRRNFDWWRTRIGNIRKNFHLYRIDHALGFFRIYAFPWTPDRNDEFLRLDEAEVAAKTGGRAPGFRQFPDDNPEHKAANQAQGEEILRFVQEASGDTTVVAEDLGTVPDYVPASLRKLNIPGFCIPCFLRAADGSYSDPSDYPRLSLAQPANHDHPPLAASWEDLWRNIDEGHNVSESRRELRHFMAFAGLHGEEPPREFSDRLREGFLCRVLHSNSWIVVVMITDLFGQHARFNTPGVAGLENWSQRIEATVAELDQDPALMAKTNVFSRLVKEAKRSSRRDDCSFPR
jgi:4-alpha-glucanotransferase